MPAGNKGLLSFSRPRKSVDKLWEQYIPAVTVTAGNTGVVMTSVSQEMSSGLYLVWGRVVVVTAAASNIWLQALNPSTGAYDNVNGTDGRTTGEHYMTKYYEHPGGSFGLRIYIGGVDSGTLKVGVNSDERMSSRVMAIRIGDAY